MDNHQETYYTEITLVTPSEGVSVSLLRIATRDHNKE